LPPWEPICWGWFKSNLSEIAAVRLFLDIIVKACTGKWALPQTSRVEIEKLSDPSFSFKSAFQIFIPLHGKKLLFFIITFLTGRDYITLGTSSTA
jgi:hypothetical protein